jgi:hypothetical protein
VLEEELLEEELLEEELLEEEPLDDIVDTYFLLKHEECL